VRKKKKNLFFFFDRTPQLCGEAAIIASEEEMKEFILTFRPNEEII